MMSSKVAENKNESESTIAEKSSNNNKNDKPTSKTKVKAPKNIQLAKIKKLTRKLEEVELEKSDLRDQLLRKAAEFENYKKRRENEYALLLHNANAEIIAGLLPVLDDLDRSIKSSENTAEFDGLFNGVKLIYKNLVRFLESYGVQPIEAVGKNFDPEKHDALMQVESEDCASGEVVEEHLKGYVMNDRVLRHSKVIVNK